MKYENYIFDLYGTLVDIHTDEEKTELWEKLAQFYGYYGAVYTAEELKNAYACLTGQKEDALRQEMRSEEHTSELQSPILISYAVFCLKKRSCCVSEKI